MSGVLHGVVASLKAAAAAATDTFWKYVTLLLNTTSTNGAQNNTFLDSSTNNFTVTRNGDTTQGSFNPYMPTGYWSGYFDGTGDYLAVADNAAFDLAASDFTVETWVNFSALPATSSAACFVSQWPQLPAGNRAWFFYLFNSAGTYQLYLTYSTNGTAQTNLSVNLSSAPTIGTWNHVAFVRSGNNFLVFWNGTQVGVTQTLSATIFNSAGEVWVGAQNETAVTYPLTGYQSNLRVVKGTAVYTANFTPSTTPLTAITNTSLLCLQDNRFKDNSTNAFAITVNGDTRISKFAPFSPPASYSTASYGGSGYFDGTGDVLTIPLGQVPLQLGNSDFTFEAWVYKTSAAATITILIGPSDYLTAANSSYVFYLTTTTSTSDVYVGSTAYSITSPNAPANTWAHVAWVRTGGTFSSYLNGTRVGTIATLGTSTVNNGITNPVAIGAYANGSTFPFAGYISNARLIKGSGGYDATQATITVPTAPLTAITNTSLLLNFTNAGIYDAATINDGQTVGNAQVSTVQAKFGTTSMGFDGTGDYIPKVDRPELRLGTADFTLEGWVYLNATGVAYGLLSKGTATTGWSVNVTSGNNLQFSYTATQLTGATALASGTWYYFAVVRSGTATGNLKVYLNGSVDATSAGAVTDNFNQTSTMYVGADRVAGSQLNGYLQDVRITNGYARTISTPTAAFPTL